MAPAGARWVTVVSLCQQLAGSGGNGRFQRTEAEAHPSLQMAGTGLQDHTGLVSIGAHPFYYDRLCSIEVDQNVAGVAVLRVGVDINVASLAVAGAQEPDGMGAGQLSGIPQSLSGKRAPALTMNQPYQVQLRRHCRQLFGNRLPGQKESPVAPGSLPPFCQPGSVCNDKGSSVEQFSADGACLINSVSQKRTALH